MTLTLTYVIKNIILVNNLKVLDGAHCLLKSYEQKKLEIM